MFELKRLPKEKKIYIYIYTHTNTHTPLMVFTHLPHDNHKPKIYKRYTYKKHNTKDSHQIRKKRKKKSKEEL